MSVVFIWVHRLEMEKARDCCYIFIGWDANGVPLPEKVAELKIE